MSIEKVTKNILQHENKPFTTMFNDVLQGTRNMAALGMYCYLASKPPGWNISKKEMQSHFQCGRDRIDSAFNYLKEMGAIAVTSYRNDKGQVTNWSTELKYNFGAKTTIRETDIVANQLSGEPAPIKERELKKKEKEENIPPPSATQSVSLLEQEYFTHWNELAKKYTFKQLSLTNKEHVKKGKRAIKNLLDYYPELSKDPNCSLNGSPHMTPAYLTQIFEAGLEARYFMLSKDRGANRTFEILLRQHNFEKMMHEINLKLRK